MSELQSLLEMRGAPTMFHHKKNRVRCFAHIINICSSHLVASMSPTSSKRSKRPTSSKRSISNGKSYISESESNNEQGIASDTSDDDADVDPDDDDDDDDADDDADDHPAKSLASGVWSKAISRDPLKRARKLVRFLRASDQRKELLRQAIQDGNERSWFSYEDGVPVNVPQLQLLKDVKTRWDSVYLMLNRLLALRPVSYFTYRPDNTDHCFMQAIDWLFNGQLKQHSSYRLSESDWKILEGLETVLEVSFYSRYSIQLNTKHDIDSSCLPTNDVIREHASGIARHNIF
jgi:hypothetical protein